MSFINSWFDAITKGIDLPVEATKFDHKYSFDVLKDVFNGELGQAGSKVYHFFGDHQDMMSANLGDMGFDEDEMIVENSDAVAAAIVAAWAAAGAAGGGAAGGAEGGAAGGGGAAGSIEGAAGGIEGGSVGAEGGGSWFDGISEWWGESGSEYWDTANEYKDYYDTADGILNPDERGASQGARQYGGGSPQISGSITGTASYPAMIARMNNTLNNQIDPFDEIVTPTGARY